MRLTIRMIASITLITSIVIQEACILPADSQKRRGTIFVSNDFIALGDEEFIVAHANTQKQATCMPGLLLGRLRWATLLLTCCCMKNQVLDLCWLKAWSRIYFALRELQNMITIITNTHWEEQGPSTRQNIARSAFWGRRLPKF